VANRYSFAAILIFFAGQAGMAGAGESQSQPGRRAIRIGVDQAAPYQSWVEGYGPVGFTVDVITEAAGRRGIILQWTFCPEGPQKALRAGHVDVWPLLGSRAARDGGFYAADAWLENEYAIIWRGGGSPAQYTEPDWAGRTVAVTNLPFGVRIAKQVLPRSSLDLTTNRAFALEHLCAGSAEGAFMEVRLLEALLLDRPKGCAGVGFRVHVISALHQAMGIA